MIQDITTLTDPAHEPGFFSRMQRRNRKIGERKTDLRWHREDAGIRDAGYRDASG